MKARICLTLIVGLTLMVKGANASVTFDFDSGPAYSALPQYQTAGGITAHFTATGQGFSIQPLPVVGWIVVVVLLAAIIWGVWSSNRPVPEIK